jgi:hypothetical protein
MLRSRPLLAAGSIALAAVVACTTSYQKGADDPNYGAPNALAGQQQPGPSSQADDDDQTGSGSTVTPECVKAGGALVDAGTCAVSFTSNILPAFKTATCQTVGSCHGGTSPITPPRIEPDDPAGTWNALATFKLSNGKLYINPCSVDPAESAIACNVNSAAPCGSLMPAGIGLPADVVTSIETWVKCGAPNN